LHVGQISGGTAHNITAKDCRFGMDFRVVPGEDPEDWGARFRARVAEVEADMQAVHPDTRIDVTPKFTVPGVQPEKNGAAESLVRQITGDNGSHMVSYGTEAGQFQNRGYSAVICGPGDIAQAHQPDEYITVDQFEAGHDFMRRLLDRLQTS
jgi:acetylornithine deacetylase